MGLSPFLSLDDGPYVHQGLAFQPSSHPHCRLILPFVPNFFWSPLSVHLTSALPMSLSGTWAWPRVRQLPQLSSVDDPTGICLCLPNSLPCFSPAVTTESSSQEFPHSISIENLSPRTPLVFSLRGMAGQQLEPNSLIVFKLWEKRVVLVDIPLPKLMQDLRKAHP